MFEWWQTVALSLGTLIVGGVIAVSSAYVQRRWSRSDTLEAAEREHEHKVAEERREAVRRHRRERIEAILDFLTLAKQYLAERDLEKVVHRKGAWDWQSMGLPALNDVRVTHAAGVAVASAPTRELYRAVMGVWSAVTGEENSREQHRKTVAAINLVDELVERYVTEV